MLALLVLACLTLITLDARGGTSSPVDPLRSAVGSVVGPAETAAAAVARPFAKLGDIEENRMRFVTSLGGINDSWRVFHAVRVTPDGQSQ